MKSAQRAAMRQKARSKWEIPAGDTLEWHEERRSQEQQEQQKQEQKPDNH